MCDREREVLASALFALFAGAVVWPPIEELVYWRAFAGIGEGVLLLVFAMSILVGAGFALVAEVPLHLFSLGGLVAYIVGMAGFEIVYSPETPVHLLLYGGVLVGFCTGVAVVAPGRQ